MKKSNKNRISFLPEKNRDLFMIDVRSIKPDFEWNPRQEYKDIEELADDILLNGVQVALKGRRLKDDPDGYQWTIIGGFRRYKACMMLLEQERITELRVPLVLEAKGTSEIDRLAYTILENNLGKPLNILEIAGVVNRMQVCGLDEKEIATRINKAVPFVKKCFTLLEAPESVKKLIQSDKISSTLAINIFSKAKDFDKAVIMLEEIAENAPRITQATVTKAQGKINSVKIFKKLSKVGEKESRLVKEDKTELYDFLKKFISGEFTAEELEQMFYI